MANTVSFTAADGSEVVLKPFELVRFFPLINRSLCGWETSFIEEVYKFPAPSMRDFYLTSFLHSLFKGNVLKHV